MAAALSRAVTLIQGPPGTGKTYIGVHIVHVLLQNSRSQDGKQAPSKFPGLAPRTQTNNNILTPILCICYTNHALDQFLEGLIKNGLAKERVIRVGGRSKSEILAGRNLRDLAKLETTSEEGKRKWRLRKDAEEFEENIKNYSQLKQKKQLEWNDLRSFLQMNHPEYYNEIISKTRKKEKREKKEKKENEEEDWWIADKPDQVFEIWKKGTYYPEYGNFWKFSLANRKKMYDSWCESILEQQEQSFKSYCERYQQLLQQCKQEENACELRVLRKAAVVGFTTSGAASHQELFQALGPRIVICEEAGEVFESHLLSSLTKHTEHLIMIGDHMQLRPKVEEHRLSIESNRGYNLDLSLFERLVTMREAEFGKRAKENGSLVTLSTQRRMRPDISNLIRVPLYPSLLDAPTVTNYPDVRGMAQNLWFFDHFHVENGGEEAAARSYANDFEAKMVVSLARHLIRQGYKPDEIAILTPYAGQLLKLRELLTHSHMSIYIDERSMEELAKMVDDVEFSDSEESDGEEDFDPFGDLPQRKKNKQARRTTEKSVNIKQCVRLSTVDNFQGEEAEVVIISTVRCNTKGRTGFLKIANRVNVMMSRAKHGMYLFGSAKTVAESKQAKVFQIMLVEIERLGRIGQYVPLKCARHPEKIIHAIAPEEFEKFAPDGGCSEPCKTRLLCGHECPRMCHPDDINHTGAKCVQRCTRLHRMCNHPCQLLCWQECGNCNKRVEFRLPCGHTIKNTECHKTLKPESIYCRELVEVNFPLCGHTSKVDCTFAAQLSERVRQLHTTKQLVIAGSNDPLLACKQQCGSQLPCSHPCEQRCGICTGVNLNELWKTTIPMFPLNVLRAQHAGKCKNVCSRTLLCGHQCKGECHGASDCPPCREKCSIKCPHTRCGRDCKEPCPSCAEPCPWVCPHYACPLPCGSPCVRLPCDKKCTKELKCGHDCPSVCGEVCPAPEVACKFCAPDKQKACVVDLIEMTTLAEQTPESEPLIALDCSHLFTLSTLDGSVGINTVYEQNTKGEWCGVLELPAKCGAIPQCPHCRKPISNVRRYGRILAHLMLEQASIKFRLKTEREAHIIIGNIANLKLQVDIFAEKGIDVDGNEFTQLLKNAQNYIVAAKRVSRTVKDEQPERRVYEKAISALDSHAKASNIPLPRYIPPSPQALIAATRAIAMAQITFFRVSSILNFHTLEKFDPAKLPTQGNRRGNAKKEPVKQQTLEEIGKACLDKMLENGDNVIQTFKELINACVESQSNKSLLESVHLQIEALYFLIWHTKKVVFVKKLPDPISAPAKEKMPLWLNLMKSSVDVVGARAPGSSTLNMCTKLHGAIEKYFRSEFYEEVSLAEKKQIFEAMSRDVGSGVGSFGGHWYTCPNGHVYTIGECGGAMQQSRCPECGASVGGQNHNRVANNSVATSFLQEVAAPQLRGGW